MMGLRERQGQQAEAKSFGTADAGGEGVEEQGGISDFEDAVETDGEELAAAAGLAVVVTTFGGNDPAKIRDLDWLARLQVG